MSSYLVRKGDSSWRIATVFTRDGKRWPELVAANPQKKRAPSGNFLMLVPGELLALPDTWPGAEPSVSDAAGDDARGVVPIPVPWLNREFFERLNEMCARLAIDPYALLLVLFRESQFAPWAVNGSSLARGLNQIMPANFASWGWSQDRQEQYSKLTATEQLPTVEKFLKGILASFRVAAFRSTPAELYLANFLPARMKAASEVGDSYILGRKPDPEKDPKSWTFEEKVYSQNAGLDHDHNEVLTAGDINAEMLKLLNNGRVAWAWSQLDAVRGTPNSGGGGLLARAQGSPIIAGIGAILFVGWVSGLFGKAVRA